MEIMESVFCFCLMSIVYVESNELQPNITEHIPMEDQTIFPFYARLEIPLYPHRYYGYACAGALIHERWILTAGHCFPKDKTKLDWILKLNLPMIFLYMKYAFIIEIHHHPQFMHKQRVVDKKPFAFLQSDIAVVKLKEPVATYGIIKTIPLTNLSGVCQYCTLIDLGTMNLTSFTIIPEIRQYANVSIKEPGNLTDPVVRYIKPTENTTFFTETGPGDVYNRVENVVQADSGGPAICEMGDKKTHVLIGVMSSAKIEKGVVINEIERIDLYINFIKQYVPEVKIYEEETEIPESRSSASRKEIKLFLIFLVIVLYLYS